MIGFEEAVELVRSVAKPLGIEKVALAEAAGRVLARPVIAGIDSPRSDVSSMDGYAVREEDLSQFPALLQVVGGSYPGVAVGRAGRARRVRSDLHRSARSSRGGSGGDSGECP